MREQRDLVRAFYEEVWNKHDLTRLPELLAEDFVFRGSLGEERRGHAGFAAYVDFVHTTLGDYRCDIEEVIAAEDKLFARMRFSGLHRGPLLGFQGTGKRVAWTGAAVFTFAHQRIAALWVLGDLYGLLQLLAAHARAADRGTGATVRSVVPLFRVPSVDATAAWYRDELGFTIDPFPSRPPYAFAMARRGAAELMLRRSPETRAPSKSGDWDAYLRLEGNAIRDLHSRLAARGHVVRALARMPYGSSEFEARDCDGRLLCFGADLGDAPDIPPFVERQ